MKKTNTIIINFLLYYLVKAIDDKLGAGFHFRDANGQLITTFDQAILAIQNNRWPIRNTRLALDLPDTESTQ